MKCWCTYCYTDTENDSLKEAIEKLDNCTNCRLDIEMKGKWTGYGWSALLALIVKYGKQAVIDAAGTDASELGAQ